MEVTDEEDWHEAAPRGTASASSQAIMLHAQQRLEQGPGMIHTAPTAVGGGAWGDSPAVLQPTPAPVAPPSHDRGVATTGARVRRAQSGPYGARDLQRRSQEAIALYDANYRMALAHKAAADSVIQVVNHEEPAAEASGSRQAPPPSTHPPSDDQGRTEAGPAVAAAPMEKPSGVTGAVVKREEPAAAAAETATAANEAIAVSEGAEMWEDAGHEAYHSSNEASAADGMECG